MSSDPKSVCPSSGSQAVHNAGRWGDYLCDSPWDLINSSVYTMRHILPDPDFILWTGTAELWGRWLDNSTVDTFRKGAYYTERLLNKSGQRVIVLNTNLYYNQNKLTMDLPDPADQFKWLEQELTSAAASKEKGKHFTFDLSLCLGSPISTMFLAPGITPWKTTLPGVENGANNPGIRVFEYDRTTLLVKDMVTYYLNLTQANLAGPRWEKEYRLTESFRVPDASARSMHGVLRQIETDDCALQRYYRFNSVNYDLSHCDSACRTNQVCAIREVDFARYEICVVTEGVALLSLAPVLLLLPAALSWEPMM
ncbi:UNVERIFIED_CONTAM: hypothetical protein FKN15_058351 [Acipenser sinensis]